MIYWFTGQPAAGKTTIAKLLAKRLEHFNPVIIDGDDIREIFQNKNYSEEGRRKNIETAQNIAHFIHKKGGVAIVSLVSPYKDQRDSFKELIGKDSLVEIYVHTKNDRGRNHLHVENYEPPTEDFINIDTTGKSDLHSTWEIIQQLGLNL